MRRFGWSALVLIGILAAPHFARAGDDAPAVVLRVKSLDTVLKNLKLLAALVGQEQAAADIQGLIDKKTGKKGLEGIDMDRPVGAYVKFGAEVTDLNLAMLIPVADQNAFMTLLENLGTNPKKEKGGVYTLQAKDTELFLRFANKYAYITAFDRDNLLDKNLLDPAKALAGPKDSLLSASLRLDKLPDGARLIVVSALDEKIHEAIDSAPKEDSDAQKAFRKAALKQVGRTISDVITEGKAARVDINLDEVKKDISIKLSMSARPKTELAKTIQNAAAGKSPFAGLLPAGAAFRGSIDAVFPDALRTSFAKLMDEAAKKVLADIADPAKRKQTQQLIDAIMPSIRAGELDAFFGMTGPVKDHYTLLAAVRVQEGDKLGTMVESFIASRQDQAECGFGRRRQDPQVRAAARRENRHGARRLAGRSEPACRLPQGCRLLRHRPDGTANDQGRNRQPAGRQGPGRAVRPGYRPHRPVARQHRRAEGAREQAVCRQGVARSRVDRRRRRANAAGQRRPRSARIPGESERETVTPLRLALAGPCER